MSMEHGVRFHHRCGPGILGRRTKHTGDGTFAPNPSDTTDALLAITYLGVAVESTDLTNMAAFGGPSVWRIDIGTSWDPQVRQPQNQSAGVLR